NAATSWRDKALWLLLAASGIRMSEARNMLLEDVLPDEQKVYVIDPTKRRFQPPPSVLMQPRFKGREIAATYLFPPLRQQFFSALEQYLKLEYVPTAKPGEAKFLFQYDEPTRRGLPLVNASDTALTNSFKKAARKANVPLRFDGREYTVHSLRHLYGVYMLNDYPVDVSNRRYGLPLTDVQMLMGHAKISSTQMYARAKRDRLMQKLEASDQALLHLAPQELKLLPVAIVEGLERGHD
ncbi:site-specific integrase, partial [Variovorax sp. dw_308]|uniref:tyrosine-type recombinase/integrase n=1 Tax=Variovorax sp. dw_308 TaxID=2721546 RepID=UPI001C47F6F1